MVVPAWTAVCHTMAARLPVFEKMQVRSTR